MTSRCFLWIALVSWLFVNPVAWAQECVAPASMAEAASASVDLLTDDEFEAAQRMANQALSGLACLQEVPTPEDLATLWQVVGAAGVYTDVAELADPNLLQAAAVHPGWFNERLGQEARERWQHAALTLETTAMIEVSPVPADGLLLVDGVVREVSGVTVLPGRHLVQVSQRNVVAFNRLVDLAPGQSASLATGLSADVPARAEEAPETRNRRYLLASLVGVVGAGAAFAGGAVLDARLSEQDTVEGMDRTFWAGHVVGYGLGGAFAAGSAISLGLHFTR